MTASKLNRNMLAALAAASLWSSALAQPHEARSGGYVLRSSTVASDRIDAATAAKHGIDTSPTRGVLNVVVRQQPGASAAEGERTVQAEVSASSRSLAGVTREIPLKEVRENNRVSYLGSYEFVPREVLDFRITARPLEGGDAAPRLQLEFRDRMWAR